jgi:small conductance mechanosensitive channel
MDKINMQAVMDQATIMIMEYGPRLLLALVTLLIGLWIIRRIVNIADRALLKGNTDKTLILFTRSLISWVLKILLLLSVASMIGIETTSFIAIFSAGTLAVGLALQGSLSNFAGGVLLLLLRPYKVGDLIEAQGYLGVVKEIHIFNTILLTPQNKTIIIPNGPLAGGTIVNYTEDGHLRVDLTIGISYDSDIKKAKDVLMRVMEENPKVLNEPPPFVGLAEFDDSSINLAVRPWANVADYWDVFFGVNESIKEALNESGIKIPFPQMDVHVTNKNKNIEQK